MVPQKRVPHLERSIPVASVPIHPGTKCRDSGVTGHIHAMVDKLKYALDSRREFYTASLGCKAALLLPERSLIVPTRTALPN